MEQGGAQEKARYALLGEGRTDDLDVAIGTCTVKAARRWWNAEGTAMRIAVARMESEFQRGEGCLFGKIGGVGGFDEFVRRLVSDHQSARTSSMGASPALWRVPHWLPWMGSSKARVNFASMNEKFDS